MPILNEREREERNEMRKTRHHHALGFVLLNSLPLIVVLFSRFSLLNWELLACQHYVLFSKGLPLSLLLNT